MLKINIAGVTFMVVSGTFVQKFGSHKDFLFIGTRLVAIHCFGCGRMFVAVMLIQIIFLLQLVFRLHRSMMNSFCSFSHSL
jgi:hypothetical protein